MDCECPTGSDSNLYTLPGSVQVVIFPFYINAGGLIDPILLRWDGIDLVLLSVILGAGCCHVCFG